MNERIGNNRIYVLAKEAGLIEFEQLDWNPDLRSPTYESVARARKFARLIVEECAEACRRVGELEQEAAIGQMYADAVLGHFGEHFGVKE